MDVAKKMYKGQPGTSDTLLYTAPSTGAIVRAIRICNETGSAATITLALNAGAALGAGEHYYSAFSVAANDVEDWTGFQVLDASETIRALQGTGSALTVVISGVEL